MADPTVAGNPTEFQRVAKAAAALEDQVTSYSRYKDLVVALQEAKQVLRESDGEPLSACSANDAAGKREFQRSDIHADKFRTTVQPESSVAHMVGR